MTKNNHPRSLKFVCVNGQIVETSKFGSIAEYREYKAAKIEAAIKSRKN